MQHESLGAQSTLVQTLAEQGYVAKTHLVLLGLRLPAVHALL